MRLVIVLLGWMTLSAASAADSTELSLDSQTSSSSESTASAALLSDGANHFFSVVRDELTQATASNIAQTWSNVLTRLQEHSTRRVLWLVIVALFASGLLFLGSVVFEIFTRRPARVDTKHSSSDNAKKTRETPELKSSGHKETEKFSGKSPVEKESLLTEKIDKIERQIRDKLKPKEANSDLHVYLFACCAARADLTRYEALVKEVFPGGLDENLLAHKHIFQIGRAISSQFTAQKTVPDPKNSYKVQKPLFEETMEAVSQLGDVETMLDMLRVYAEMELTMQTVHLIVEALVQGDFKQRKRVLEYCLALSDGSKHSKS